MLVNQRVLILKEMGKSIKYLIMAIITAALAVSGADAFEPPAFDIAALDKLRQIEPNLAGEGVKVCVVERSETYQDNLPTFDYKPDTDHSFLAGANIILPLEKSFLSTKASFHSTAICSILAGKGIIETAEGQTVQYAAPLTSAEIEVLEFWEFAVGYLLNTDNRLDADVLSASFGSAAAQWWTNAMQYITQRDNLLSVASIGNGSEFSSPLYPAAGANFLAVGLADRQMLPTTNSYWLDDEALSSSGITFEGLIKPDIVAPGNYLVAEIGTDLLAETGSYSSYAAPAVAAIGGLLIEKARQSNLEGAFDTDGAGTVIKAILMSSAAKGAGWHKGGWDITDDFSSPLDLIQGSGIVDAEAAIKLLTAGKYPDNDKDTSTAAGWDNNTIDAKSENSYWLQTTPDARYISATLVWNRQFASQYPFQYLPEENVNLRLELWAINTEDPNQNILVDYSDSPNSNVEHIFFPVSGSNQYELVVLFSDDEDIEKNISQRYALAFTETQMPAQWVGNWLDFDGDGKLTSKDLMEFINLTLAEANNDSQFNTRFMNTLNILINELGKINK